VMSAITRMVPPHNGHTEILLPGSGINLDHYAYTPLPQSAHKVFVRIGRLIWDKGVREYLAAAALVKQEFPESRFILIGPSSVSNLSALTESEVKAIQEGNIVEYLWVQDNVVPWLKKTHTLVLTSYREGMPRTV
jgi:glycosyltransferase involved in cell wall biosynthesis